MVDIEDFEEERLAPEVFEAARIIEEQGLNVLLETHDALSDPENVLEALRLVLGSYEHQVTGEW